MKVFGPELRDGLGEALAGDGRLSVAALATACEPFAVVPTSSLQDGAGLARGTNLAQADLFYLKSVLVTAGTLNKNDDYFDKVETWAARHMPEDKPLNYEHKQDDIFGHITACWGLGCDGKDIPDDTAAAALPDKFHIATSAVVYRYCDVAERQKRIDQAIAGIKAGTYAVSMEVLFKGFDYVLLPRDGASAADNLANAQFVERSDKTAFLTKHLRAYGGTGVWNNQTVGRVLRNLLFHGKGLVKNPANPESVIFAADAASKTEAGETEKPVAVETVDTTPSTRVDEIPHPPAAAGYATPDPEIKESQMTEVELKAKVAELEAKLATAEAAADTKALQKELAAATEKATKAAETATATAAKLVDAETKAADAEKRATAAEAKLADIEAKAKHADRLTRVKAAFELETDDEAAKLMADQSYTDLADDKFAKAMSAQADYLAKKKAAYVAATQVGESKVSDKPAPMGGGAKPVKTSGDGVGSGTLPAGTNGIVPAKADVAAAAAAVANATTKDAAAATEQPAETFEAAQADVLEFLKPKAAKAKAAASK